MPYTNEEIVMIRWHPCANAETRFYLFPNLIKKIVDGKAHLHNGFELTLKLSKMDNIRLCLCKSVQEVLGIINPYMCEEI